MYYLREGQNLVNNREQGNWLQVHTLVSDPCLQKSHPRDKETAKALVSLLPPKSVLLVPKGWEESQITASLLERMVYTTFTG